MHRSTVIIIIIHNLVVTFTFKWFKDLAWVAS
jgi:hypothetical protein